MSSDLIAELQPFWQAEPFSLSQPEKEAMLLARMNALSAHHRTHCEAYANICNGMGLEEHAGDLETLPYLAVRLFKQFDLHSLGPEQPFKTLHSSGTSGQQPAIIRLDKETSSAQSKALVRTLQTDLGKQRLPMLIIDSPAVLKDRNLFSARGAGIQGLSLFGREHTYALNEDMSLNLGAIEAFLSRHQGQSILLFGFTFMVWLYWVQALEQQGMHLDIPRGILLHSGGWKKLVDQQVDNATFKRRLQATTGIKHVVNFYGMAEQVGSVFTECSAGHLHCSLFNDVIIRDFYDLTPLKPGQEGLIQVLSALPMSYPGYSLLTEDKGRLIGTDDCNCGRKGKYFEVLGRLPKVEARGCSDTYTDNAVGVI